MVSDEQGTKSGMILAIIVLSIFVSAASAFLVSHYGLKISLVDKPNERSSHSIPTPRSGGIGIWLVFLFVGFFFIRDFYFTSIAFTAGLIGFLEDRFTLPSASRLLIQFVLSIAVVYLFRGWPVSMATVSLFLFWIIFITGTVNFYNFMDGINGIAGFTGLVGFGLMSFFSYYITNNPDIALMSLVLASGCLGFLPFNFPKAKVFMGDVGSIFLGFVFASFVVKLSTSIGIFLCLIMFLCTFYADALVTIFYRRLSEENLMEAHRNHLYQYMSNELRLPHWMVSLMYLAIQLIFGLLALLAYSNGLVWQLILFVVFCIIFLLSYKIIKNIKPRAAKEVVI